MGLIPKAKTWRKGRLHNLFNLILSNYDFNAHSNYKSCQQIVVAKESTFTTCFLKEQKLKIFSHVFNSLSFPNFSISNLIPSFCHCDSLTAFIYCCFENIFNEDSDTLILCRYSRFSSDISLQFPPLHQFFKTGVLKNFTRFTRKHLRQSLFCNKAASCLRLY